MAMHFTENKANANASAIKTPFLIEDILDRNTAKLDNKLLFYKNHDKHDSVGPNARNNNGGEENIVNNRIEKNLRNNSEMLSNDSDEYRKLLQSERYEEFFFLKSFLDWILSFSPTKFHKMK